MILMNCARCGGEHEVEWKLFTNPITDWEGSWTHWALCPTNGEPILMKVTVTDAA